MLRLHSFQEQGRNDFFENLNPVKDSSSRVLSYKPPICQGFNQFSALLEFKISFFVTFMPIVAKS